MIRMLPWILRVETLALGLWIGSILFFSTTAAPTAFRSLDVEHAGTFIRSIFPKYYAFGIVCGVVALTGGVAVSAWAGGRLGWVSTALIGVMLATTVYARQGLMPRVDAYRLARAEAAESDVSAYERANASFRAAHRTSVVLNGLVLLLGVIAFLLVRMPDSPTDRAGG